MMRFANLAVVAAMTVATPALADKLFAVTPSGAAETLFPDKAATVVSQLSSKCIDARMTIISSTATELVCESPLSMGQSIVGQLLMGNSYSTPPRRFFRFNVAEINGVSRVQASGWMELQMAFGQVKRTDFSGPEFQNGIMNFMVRAGGKLPTGTTFPNHAFMGYASEDAVIPGGTGLRVTMIQPQSPVARAGVQVGDVITSVAHKRFKNAGQLLDATAKAAEAPSYEVEFIRGGKKMTVTLQREYRPSVSEEVVAKADVPMTPTSAPPASVADELQKLADLRAKGVITPEEFAAQKKKLLGI